MSDMYVWCRSLSVCCTLGPAGGRRLFFIHTTKFFQQDVEKRRASSAACFPSDPNFSPAGPCSKECFGPSSVRVAPAVSMFPRQNPACLCALGAVFLLVSGEEVSESRSGMIQELRSALADLAGEGKTYLGRLAGEQTVLSVQKAFSQVLGVVAEGLASGLNVLLQHVSHLLQAAGVQVVFPINRVTPEGLLFLAQWVLVALIGYWLVSFAFCLVASTLRRAVWLLKVGVALACFGFILRDHSVGTETLAVRLAVLVCACVLLGVGTSKGPDAADKTAHLEEQVRILERRLREMEKWTKAE